MAFYERTQKSKILIELLSNYFWKDAKENFNLIHEPYGYENFVAKDIQELLKKSDSSTAKYIRFSPDYIIGNQGKIILADYKATTTPRYTTKSLQWNIGQVEADAWENYEKLTSIGVDIALLIYCPYHPRPLLCDTPDNSWLWGARSKVKNTQTGSYTDYVNLDLTKLKTFVAFMEEVLNIPPDFSKPKVASMLEEAKNLLPTTHDVKSNYKQCETGFNWKQI